jgi:HSP20 family protein
MRTLTLWNPLREMALLPRRLETLFDHLTDSAFAPWERDRALWKADGWMPAIEGHVDNGALVIKVDLPGIDPKEVSISVGENRLTIEGERKHEENKEEKDYRYREVAYGKFSRTIALPDGVATDAIKATYKDGVLAITMPAPAAVTAKKIPVETP